MVSLCLRLSDCLQGLFTKQQMYLAWSPLRTSWLDFGGDPNLGLEPLDGLCFCLVFFKAIIMMLCSCWRWEKFRTFRLAAEQHRTDLLSCLSENFNSQMNGKWKLEINPSALFFGTEWNVSVSSGVSTVYVSTVESSFFGNLLDWIQLRQQVFVWELVLLQYLTLFFHIKYWSIHFPNIM